jgi:GT2 family glycosyltransferase
MVQSAGIVLGTGFKAVDALGQHLADDAGYADLLRVAREPSAVTGACLLTPKADYEALGGLDEARFPVLFNDVDYGLRLREAGRRVVFTPHARLVHRESATRGADSAGADRMRLLRDLAVLRERWGEALADDPAYSQLLNRDAFPYSGLAWPPGRRRPRRGAPVRAPAHPAPR